MTNLIKAIYKKGMLYLLLSALFLLNACGMEDDTFHRMPELVDRNMNFEKVVYSGPYTIFNITNYIWYINRFNIFKYFNFKYMFILYDL